MEYQNGQPLPGRAPAEAHGPHLERISRPEVTVPALSVDLVAHLVSDVQTHFPGMIAAFTEPMSHTALEVAKMSADL